MGNQTVCTEDGRNERSAWLRSDVREWQYERVKVQARVIHGVEELFLSETSPVGGTRIDRQASLLQDFLFP